MVVSAPLLERARTCCHQDLTAPGYRWSGVASPREPHVAVAPLTTRPMNASSSHTRPLDLFDDRSERNGGAEGVHPGDPKARLASPRLEPAEMKCPYPFATTSKAPSPNTSSPSAFTRVAPRGEWDL